MSSGTSTEPTPPSAPLQPWQFFVLAALGCATAVAFLVRSQGVASVVLLSIIMGATALVGLGVLHTLRPLLGGASAVADVGGRARAALEQEKALVLRTIKELEFDRAMGKLSEHDFAEMSGRLRARASRLIRQLDAGSDYRSQVEQELARRLATLGTDQAAHERVRRCASCETSNEADAKFCKACGAKLS